MRGWIRLVCELETGLFTLSPPATEPSDEIAIGGEGENSFCDGNGQSLGADSFPPMIPIIEAPAIRNTQCLLILPN